MRLTPPRSLASQDWPALTNERRAALKDSGLEIVGELSVNKVFLEPGFSGVEGGMTIIFEGRSNAVYLGRRQRFHGPIKFDGDDSVVELAGGDGLVRLGATIYSAGRLAVGPDCVFFGVVAWVHGGARLTVGENCLFSEPVHFRTSDHHSIIDLKTMQPVNFPADIQIGAHVWIGPGVTVNKGVSIGDGSIVGAGSLVTKPIPDRELWVGVPARRLRQNVSWVGSLPAIREHIDDLVQRFDLTARAEYP